jgi:hypothetical protein
MAQLSSSFSRARRFLVSFAAFSFVLILLSAAWISWPVVSFLYRERTLAEAVRKYSETAGLPMTSDDDVRAYLVKLSQHYKLDLREGDVDIDYHDAPATFGIPNRIGYTLSAKVNFYGLRMVPLIAQRSFAVSSKAKE